MKLQSRKKKNLTIAIIALAVIAVVAIVIGVILLLPKDNSGTPSNPNNPNNPGATGDPTAIESIMISSTSNKIEYYVGEAFDPTGASIQVLTVDRNNSYFVNYEELEFSGFDSSVANDSVVITVTYKGFTASFTVKVKEDPSTNQGNGQEGASNIEVCDFQLEYTLERWNRRSPKTYGSYVKITRPDGSVYGSPDDTPITGNNIVNYQTVDAPCDYDLIIVYVDTDGTEYTTTVTIKITN